MAESWSCAQVCDWLARNKLDMYIPEFQEQGVTGRELLQLTPTDIRLRLRVAPLQHRKELYAGILRLKEGLGDPPAHRHSWTVPESSGRYSGSGDPPTGYSHSRFADIGLPPFTSTDHRLAGEVPFRAARAYPASYSGRRHSSSDGWPPSMQGVAWPQQQPASAYSGGATAAAPWPTGYPPAGDARGTGQGSRPLFSASQLLFDYGPDVTLRHLPTQNPAVQAQLRELELLAGDLVAIEGRATQLQADPAAHRLKEVDGLLSTVDGMLQYLGALKAASDAVRVERRLHMHRADGVRQRLLLLQHLCKTAAPPPAAPAPAERAPRNGFASEPPPRPASEPRRESAPPEAEGHPAPQGSAIEEEQPTPTAVVAEVAERLARAYSDNSSGVIGRLQVLGARLAALERQAEGLDAEDRDGRAALFGQAEKMLLHDIDAVATADLESGRNEARAERRALVRRAEALLTALGDRGQTGPLAQDPSEAEATPPPELPREDSAPSGRSVRFDCPEVEDEVDPPNHAGEAPGDAVSREYSMKSRSAIECIEALKAEVEALEDAVTSFVPGDPQYRTDIAQMFGAVEKLLLTRIDAVLCGDLSSGQAAAKAGRRALVARCTALLDRLVELQQDLK